MKWTHALLAVAVVAATGGATAAVLADDPSASVVARYPSDDEMAESTLVAPGDVTAAEAVAGRNGRPVVSVTLTEAGAESFAETLVDAGFTEDGVDACPAEEPTRNDGGYCILTVVDGNVTKAAALGPGLARDIENGDFADGQQFVMVVANQTEAERVAAALGGSANATTTEATTATDSRQTETTTSEPASESTTAPATESTTAPTTESDDSGTDVPGFGVGVALAAVAAAGALAVGRRE